ncbi:nicotinate-nucleotide adenylyltransferase [Myxococcota bacterium]|nr:nicotinate-nucleotide adenylyltransferase [Myxococcota bacterium]
MKTDDGAARIGLFGGTFNPIHLGHLRAAEEVREALGLAGIAFVPSNVPPHKRERDGDPIAPATQRVAWVEAAIAGHDAFSLDRVELDREGPSYLVDTLAAVRARKPAGPPPVFVVGEDAFAEMGEWRSPLQLFALADFAVMTRPPGRLDDLADRIPAVVRGEFSFEGQGRVARHRSAGTRIDLVSITALDVSSSQIRRACREGRSIRWLVPESIRGAIEQSRCYAASGDRRAAAEGTRR